MKELNDDERQAAHAKLRQRHKRKVKSTATFVFKKLDSDLQRIPAEEIAFYNEAKLSVSIDRVLRYYYPEVKCFGNRITRTHLR